MSTLGLFLLTGIPHLKHGIRMVYPRHRVGTGCAQQDDRSGVGLGCFFDQAGLRFQGNRLTETYGSRIILSLTGRRPLKPAEKQDKACMDGMDEPDAMSATPPDIPGETRNTFLRQLRRRPTRLAIATAALVLSVLVLYGVVWRGFTPWVLLMIPIMCFVLGLSVILVREVVVASLGWLSASLKSPERRERLVPALVLMMLALVWLICMVLLI